MKFRTELNLDERSEIIDYSKKILCIGSCFAEHLHSYLKLRKYNSFLNPCGISYNPISIANSIYYLLGMSEVRMEDIKERNGVFFHHDFHSKFSAGSPEQVMSNIEEHLAEGSEFASPDVLILSLGSAYTYFLKSNDEAVNNCHKISQSYFEKVLLSVEETTITLNNAIAELKRSNPKMQIIATVSPVRHLKDGMIQNNLSKSSLLLSIPQLENVTYFPSYELLLDDLRDYRFYAKDLVHPSSEAVDYILSFFEGQFMSATEEKLRNEILQISKDLNHRPFLPHSDQHLAFKMKLRNKMETLMKERDVDFKGEIDSLGL